MTARRKKGTKKPSPRHKTAAETAGTSPALVPQKNGGALLAGGQPGNAGGTGRPKDRIRAILTGHYEKNLKVVDDIATGVVMQTIEVPLVSLIGHVKCPKCEEPLKLSSPEEILTSIQVRSSASPKDRLGAVDHQARYSIGAVKEISIDNVRERLEQQITLLQTRFTGVVLENLLADLRAIWNS